MQEELSLGALKFRFKFVILNFLVWIYSNLSNQMFLTCLLRLSLGDKLTIEYLFWNIGILFSPN